MSDIARYFPRVPAAQAVKCCKCGTRTCIRIPVRHIPRSSGPDHILYACPVCAPYVVPGPTLDELAPPVRRPLPQ